MPHIAAMLAVPARLADAIGVWVISCVHNECCTLQGIQHWPHDFEGTQHWPQFLKEALGKPGRGGGAQRRGIVITRFPNRFPNRNVVAVLANTT
jgi:hypothetical protein